MAGERFAGDSQGGCVKLRGLCWWIVALIFGAAVLNYVDRQTLSALAPTIQHDLEMDDRAYAQWFLLMAFLHLVAWCLLKFGGVPRLRPTKLTQ
jgi:uncharacterized membrane protein YhdT